MKASAIIGDLCKAAGYLADIKCERCSYQGKPDGNDGRCPLCGAIGGVKPKEAPTERGNDIEFSKDLYIGRMFDEMERAKSDAQNYM